MAKRPVEQILVSKDLSPYAGGRTMNQITDPATLLADGQLAFFDVGGLGSNPANQSFAAASIGNSPRFVIIQGTPDTSNPQLLDPRGYLNRVYERSEIIQLNTITQITAESRRRPTQSTWAVGEASGNTGAIGGSSGVIQDETEYALRIAFRGVRLDYLHSQYSVPTLTSTYVTKDYTGLGMTAAQALDDLVQHLVDNINRHSVFSGRGGAMPVLAFAIAPNGSGVPGAVDLSTVTAGTTALPSGYSVSGGVFTQEMVDALNAVGSNVTGYGANLEVLPIDLANAGTGTSGAQSIVVMALDMWESFADEVEEVKVRLDIGKSAGFLDSTVAVEVQKADEGSGQPKVWKKKFAKATQFHRTDQNKTEFPVINVPDHIDLGTEYKVFTIIHARTNTPGLAEEVRSPLKTVVLAPELVNGSAASNLASIESYFTNLASAVGLTLL